VPLPLPARPRVVMDMPLRCCGTPGADGTAVDGGEDETELLAVERGLNNSTNEERRRCCGGGDGSGMLDQRLKELGLGLRRIFRGRQCPIQL